MGRFDSIHGDEDEIEEELLEQERRISESNAEDSYLREMDYF